jgi:hypothetical protein
LDKTQKTPSKKMQQEYKPDKKQEPEKSQTQPELKPTKPSNLETALTESESSCLDLCILPITDLTKPKLLSVYIRPAENEKSKLHETAREKITYRINLKSEDLNDAFLQAITVPNFIDFSRKGNCFSYTFNAISKPKIYETAKRLEEENH